MSSDDGSLFSGVEEGSKTTGQAPLKGGDPLTSGSLDPRTIVTRWAKDLTYDEVHAFVVGFVPWFLYFLTGHVALLGAGIVVIAAALGLRKLPNRTLGYLVGEPHYCLGGAALGWLLGSVAFSAFRVVDALIGVVT